MPLVGTIIASAMVNIAGNIAPIALPANAQTPPHPPLQTSPKTTSQPNLQPRLSNSSAHRSGTQGLPGRRMGAGSRRQSCPSQTPGPIALMPATNLSLTTQDRPTLLFYLPKYTNNNPIEFTLLDSQTEPVYQNSFQAPPQTGYARLELSQASGMPALQANRPYRWYLNVICNAKDRSQDLRMDGWLQRVDLPAMATNPASLVTQPQTLSPLAQAQRYQSLGLSTDAIDLLTQPATLATNRHKSPGPTQWQSLLADLGLDRYLPASLDPASVRTLIPSPSAR